MLVHGVEYSTLAVHWRGLVVVWVRISSVSLVKDPEPVLGRIRCEAERPLMSYSQALGVVKPGDQLPSGLVQPGLVQRRMELGCHKHTQDPKDHKDNQQIEEAETLILIRS